MTKDMTKGSPMKLILGFSIPLFFGFLFQQFYSLVDTVIVGRFLGTENLAAVGATGSINFLIIGFCMGVCSGFSIPVSHKFGAGDDTGLRKVVANCVWLASGFAVVLTVVTAMLARQILVWMKTPENIIDRSYSYIWVIFLGIPVTFLYNMTSGVIRALGDSKTPVIFLVMSSFLNVGLDLFLITVCGLGVAGAAYATVLSQLLSAVICIVYLVKKRRLLGLSGMGLKPDRHFVLLIMKTGFPAAFQSCMISLGGMSVQRLVNSYGASVMAAYVAANRIDSMAIQIIVSIGTALSVFTGQNMGQDNFGRIHEGLKKTLGMMLAASSMMAVLVFAFRRELMGIFLDPSESAQAVGIGAVYLSVIGAAYLIAGVMQSYQNVIRGAGDVNTCMVAGLTELAGRIVFAYLLSSVIGVTGIWIATPLSWGCGCVIPVVRYYGGKWKTKKLIEGGMQPAG